MKHTHLLIGFVLHAFEPVFSQNVAINDDGSTPDGSAALHVKSTSKGLLIPTMTAVQRNVISSPANGLMVYQTDDSKGFYYYNGTSWILLMDRAGTPWIASGNNVFDTSGNVGIGTISPSELLDVNGDIKINGLKIGKGPGNYINNTVVGKSAFGSNVSGDFNTVIGANTLINNTSGANNTVSGYSALYYNSTGSDNTANGYYALFHNISGSNNTANGYFALFNNISGVNNTANGNNALYSLTSGNSNDASGDGSLYFDTSGSYNTAHGASALFSNISGNNNTAIGYYADVATDALTNATAIGSEAVVNASNKIQLGNINVTSVATKGKLTTGTVTYPNTDGTSGQILTTNGSGTISWATPSSGATQLSELSDISSATKTSGHILVADGTNFRSVEVSGDASLDSSGALTIEDNAITISKMATSGTLPAFNGSNLTNLNATNLSSGTVGTARLGSGTANNTTYLRGDGSWVAPTFGATQLSGLSDISNATKTSGHILVANGTNFRSVAVSGDASLDSAGSLTVVDDAITATKIANMSVSENKIIDAAITTVKIHDGSVTSTKIASATITGNNIANSTIGIGKINASGTADSTTYLRGDGTWSVPGGASTPTPNFLYKTDHYTITNSDVANNLILVVTSGANRTMTIPRANTVSAGKIIYISTTNFPIDILSSASDTFLGQYCPPGPPATTSSTDFYGVQLMSNGIDKWIIIYASK